MASCGFSKNAYRGLVKIGSNASYSRNYSQCDSFLLGASSVASTYPYLDIWNSTAIVEHEATVSKISDDQLFYLMSRGLEEDEAMAMIVRGFIEPIARELPMEYALELNRLIEMQMEGSVG
jgi:Fe-S cluster assembly protein SufB